MIKGLRAVWPLTQLVCLIHHSFTSLVKDNRMCENPFHRHNSGHLSACCLSSQEEEQWLFPPQDISALLVFAILGLFRWIYDLSSSLNIALLCVSGSDGKSILAITRNITAALGEDVYLGCRYLGDSVIERAEWKRHINSENKLKRLAGFNFDRPFSRDGFSDPDSATNLTVKMSVSSVEVEGEYICEFASEDDYYYDNVFVTVVGKPSQ